MAVISADGWRKIAITLIDQDHPSFRMGCRVGVLAEREGMLWPH